VPDVAYPVDEAARTAAIRRLARKHRGDVGPRRDRADPDRGCAGKLRRGVGAESDDQVEPPRVAVRAQPTRRMLVFTEEITR
jgi:hypothetical protein